MAAQDNVRQILATDDADDVLDVRAEINRAAHQVGTFAEAGECRRIDLVPSLPQQPRHPLITPAAMPRAVNQNEGGHGYPLTVWPIRCDLRAKVPHSIISSARPTNGR